jgi:hypothetical protein
MQSTAHYKPHTAYKLSRNGYFCSRRLGTQDATYQSARLESQGVAIRLRRDSGKASSRVQRTANTDAQQRQISGTRSKAQKKLSASLGVILTASSIPRSLLNVVKIRLYDRQWIWHAWQALGGRDLSEGIITGLIKSALHHRWSHSTTKYEEECEDRLGCGIVTLRGCPVQNALLKPIPVRTAVDHKRAVPSKV